jgi:hypothetical protein
MAISEPRVTGADQVYYRQFTQLILDVSIATATWS